MRYGARCSNLQTRYIIVWAAHARTRFQAFSAGARLIYDRADPRCISGRHQLQHRDLRPQLRRATQSRLRTKHTEGLAALTDRYGANSPEASAPKAAKAIAAASSTLRLRIIG